MTLIEARWLAHRLAAKTGQPMVMYRCGTDWEVQRNLAAARWLADDGEVVLPRSVQNPELMERRLRFEASRLWGRGRLKLLEAAFVMRCRRGAAMPTRR